MKPFFLVLIILLATKSFGQSGEENKLLQLSHQIFNWETENKIDSLENVFDEKFVVANSSGESQTKLQYISKLKSGHFVHNNIVVEQNTVVVANNTAIVMGKGKFTITASGNKTSIHLSYIEVFTKPDADALWKVLAMQANRLQD